MKKEQLDFDSIYLEEFNLSSNYYFEKVKTVINSNSNRKGSFIKQRIHDFLDETQVSLNGFRNENTMFQDRYFVRLLAEFDSVTRSYNEAPIANFILNEYQELRKQFINFPNPVRPEIYLFNEVDTVKYLANYHALTKLFDKIKNINWWDEHPVELFLSKVNDKDYFEPGIDYSSFINQLSGNGIPKPKAEKKKNLQKSPSAHAIAYQFLFEAEPKKYPKGTEYFDKYIIDNKLKDNGSFRTMVNRAEKKLSSFSLEYFEEARKIIVCNSNVTALKSIDKMIKLLNKDKAL